MWLRLGYVVECTLHGEGSLENQCRIAPSIRGDGSELKTQFRCSHRAYEWRDEAQANRISMKSGIKYMNVQNRAGGRQFFLVSSESLTKQRPRDCHHAIFLSSIIIVRFNWAQRPRWRCAAPAILLEVGGALSHC